MAYLGNSPTSSDFTTDTFSGTGAQVNFTMTQTPVNNTSIMVFVDGARKTVADYTKSGYTLTFNVAPASGTNNIEVVHLGLRRELSQLSADSVSANELDGGDVVAIQTKLGIVDTNLGYTTAASTGTVTSDTGTNSTLPAATTSLAGLLTGADKTKLDGIATSANNYSLPNATNTVAGGVKARLNGTTAYFTINGATA